MDDPIHAVGLSELLSDIGISDDVDLEEIEKEIVNGKAEDNKEDDLDPMESFRNNVEVYGNMAMDENEQADESENEDNYVQEYKEDKEDKPLENYLNNVVPYQSKSPTSYSYHQDKEFRRITEEQEKSEKINSIMEDIDVEGYDEINAMSEMDDKERLLAGIDELRDTLEMEKINLNNIPIVDTDSPYRDILAVHRTLREKNDRLRYCTFAEDMALSGAYGLEYLFDGKKEWFGRTPDLVGWSGTVKTKLRRMRYETSTFVHGIMSDYNISGGMRLTLELIFSMFTYSRRRKVTSSDQLNSDISFKEATAKMNQF